MRRILAGLLAAGGLAGLGAGDAPAPALPDLVPPVCAAPPVLDGILDDACWTGAAVLGRLFVLGTNAVTDRHRVRLCRDDAWLYVAFDAALPADPMPATYGWDQAEPDRKLHREDHAAFSFDPTGNSSFFYQFWVSRAAVRAESRLSRQRGWELDWEIPWRAAVGATNGRWQVEMALPWKPLFSIWGPDTGRFNAMIRTVTPRRDPHGVVIAETVEEASWSPLVTNFREPERFGHLRLPAETRFREPFLPLMKPPVVAPFRIEDGRYSYTVTVSLTNESALPGTVVVAVLDEPAAPAAAPRLVSTNAALAGRAGAAIALTVPVTALEQRTVRARLRAADSAEWLQETALREPAVFDVLVADLDRNYYTDETVARVDCRVTLPAGQPAGHVLRIEDAAGRALASGPASGPAPRLEVPLAGVAVGRHNWRAALADAAGRPLAERHLALVKRPPKPGCEWKVDRLRRVLLDNGTPFFPFGVVAEMPVEPFYFQTLAAMGFNSLIQWSGSRDPASAAAYLDLAARHGLNVVFAPEHIYSRWDETTRIADPGGILAPDQRALLNDRLKTYGGSLLKMKGALLEAPFSALARSRKAALFLEYYRRNLPYIAAALEAAVPHPAVMGYFILDEPLIEVGQDDVGRALYAELNRRDGYRPVFVNYSSSIPDTPAALDWSDALGTDPYWVPGGIDNGSSRAAINFMPRTVAMTRVRADRVRSVAWTMPMAERWSGCTKRALTAAEQRCQTWLALIQGTKGIFYFKYPLASLEMVETLTQLAGWMKRLAPACLEPDPPQMIAYAPGEMNPALNRFPDVQAVLKADPAGGYVLLAANSAAYPVDTTIAVEGLPGGLDAATDLLASRRLPADGGRLRDRFEPYGVRAYALGRAEPTADRQQSTVTIHIAMTALTNAALVETGYDRQGRLERRNRLPNPSYEEASLKGWPDYHSKVWGERQSLDGLIGGTNQNWGLSAERPYHGARCLMLRTTNAADRVIAYTDLLVKNDRPRGYVVSAWLRASRDGVKVALNTGESPRVEKDFTLGPDWRRVAVPFTLPPGEFYVPVMVILRDVPGDTTVWVDALQFEQGTEPTDYEP